MIALACVLAYLAASLYGARHLYARLRARAIDKHAARNAEFRYITSDSAVKKFNEWDKGETVVGSVLLAVFWPLALTGYAVYRYVTTNPAPSSIELAAEHQSSDPAIQRVMAGSPHRCLPWERLRRLRLELGFTVKEQQ